MKFIFVEPFDLTNWNGKIARYTNGISGSHTAIFYLAEAIAQDINHEVIVVSLKNHLVEDTHLGVKYINYDNFKTCVCDYIVLPNLMEAIYILKKITFFQKIIIQTHNDLYFSDNKAIEIFSSIDKQKIMVAYISEFAKKNILNEQPFLLNYDSFLLYNSLDISDIQEINCGEKENTLSWFACLDRGYKLVEKIVERLEGYTLHANAYIGNAHHFGNSYINKNSKISTLDDSSKVKVFKQLTKSKYFIYPLINLENNSIHYDTFAYCVLEALLHGTIVITPKIGVFEELYGDAICYIETDDIIPKEDLLFWKKKNPNFGYPLVDRYIEKVKLLDSNEELRKLYIQKGLALKEKFSNKKIVNTFYNALNIEKYKKVTNEKTILTVFSGREQNMRILHKYLKKAMELNIIHEVHFWNYTKKISDEIYIKSISNLKRTSSSLTGRYNSITPVIQNNSFQVNLRTHNDFHIKIIDTNTNNEYETVLGACDNNMTIIRQNGIPVQQYQQKNIVDHEKHNSFTFSIHNNILFIFKNTTLITKQTLLDDFEIKEIYCKTGHESVGDIEYKTTQNEGFYFMDTCDSTWKNYYQHYDNDDYHNSTILKCDDDIIFMDINKLQEFIDFIKNNNYDLVFANTINNGVSAFFQQKKYNLIPYKEMILEYPPNGIFGSLWESGEKSEKLHRYFIENYQKFINYDYKEEIIPITTRFSINFFGYKGKNWGKIKDCYLFDERNLTVDYLETKSFKNVLYSSFYVSHLSFCKQEETEYKKNEIISLYDNLCEKILRQL